MKELIVLVGPPGSGKSTLAATYTYHVRVSQDDQGKSGHMKLFNDAIASGQPVIVDRMGFNKQQRVRYLQPAKAAGYTTKIIVLHENSKTCMERMLKREGHPTINGNIIQWDIETLGEEPKFVTKIDQKIKEQNAKSALHTFFKGYERPEVGEANEIEFRYPNRLKPQAVICDLDGTLCDTTHRQHFVQRTSGKKDWRGFFAGMDKDPVNKWCKELVHSLYNNGNRIIYCSGRGEEYRERTEEWLFKNGLLHVCQDDLLWKQHVYMRQAGDSRVDWQIKENILDFEILSQFTVLFAIDDRQQVVDMWRKRGITALQCAVGDF